MQQQINANRAKTEGVLSEVLETNDQASLLIPGMFLSRLSDLLRQYLDYDDKDCSLEFIEGIDEKVNGLYFEIDDWADEHDFDFDNDDTKIIIDSILSDLEESLEAFSVEESAILTLAFDESWKADMLDWLDLVE